MTDSCPRCCRCGIAPASTRRNGDQTTYEYRCRCGRTWTTSRLNDAYRRAA